MYKEGSRKKDEKKINQTYAELISAFDIWQ